MISSLRISDTVEICVTDKDSVKHAYKTKIEDISLNNIFYTMAPTDENGRIVAFAKGHKYDMYLQRAEGITMWTVEFLSSEKLENRVSCQFRAVNNPIVTQRREFFRQPVRLDFDFQMVSTEIGENETETLVRQLIKEISFATVYNGRMIDLSGGGCAFNADLFMPLQGKIKMRFNFRGKDFEFEATILDRVRMSDTGARWDYRYRAKFENTKERVVDNLIRLVFEEQRESLINNGTLGGDRFV